MGQVHQAASDTAATMMQHMVLRPHRQVYPTSALGPSRFSFGGLPFKRADFAVRSRRGLLLQCSHWYRPRGLLSGSQLPRDYAPPCIIYLHTNSGSRIECIDVLAFALTFGCTLLAFDFGGSGLSEGDHSSLGWYEQEDVRSVVQHLRVSGGTGPIALWGRSMGAVTAMLYCDSPDGRSSVEGVVLDSPFSDFSAVATDLVEATSRRGPFSIPGWLAKPYIANAASTLKTVAGFDPREIDLAAVAQRASVPAIFLVAEQDEMVPPWHGTKLAREYNSCVPRGLLLFTGDHNCRRPAGVYEAAADFLAPLLRVPPQAARPVVPVPLNGLRPPWEPPAGRESRGMCSAGMCGMFD